MQYLSIHNCNTSLNAAMANGGWQFNMKNSKIQITNCYGVRARVCVCMYVCVCVCDEQTACRYQMCLITDTRRE